jgi:diadenosine tetraphosphatase ApaH/serine/threonine PP2A family protein phosphatase
VYPDSDLGVYADIPYDIVFMGHTHRQFLRRQSDKWFCNVGSVGLPRDNGRLMGFAIFDTSDGSIVLYRKKIDAERIKEVYSGRTTGDVLSLLDRQEEIHYSYLSE